MSCFRNLGVEGITTDILVFNNETDLKDVNYFRASDDAGRPMPKEKEDMQAGQDQTSEKEEL